MSKKILLIVVILWANTAFSQTTGTVYRDYNGNGIQGVAVPNLEPGISGIIVNAYNSSDVLVASYTTGATGTYSIPLTGSTYNGTVGSGTGSVATGVSARIEFVIPTSNTCGSSTFDYSSFNGTGNKTSVQFVTGGTTSVNYGINNPADYTSSSNPTVFVAQHVSGDPTGGGNSGSATNWFKGFPYNNTGTTTPTLTLAGTTIGSCWGVAFSKQAQVVFTAAFMRRQVGFGTAGSGGIYKLVPTATSFTASSFYDLDANHYHTRASATATAYGSGTSYSITNNNHIATFLGSTDPNTGLPYGFATIGTNVQRGLPNTYTGLCYDPAALAQVGKVGLGDLEISDDGNYLFVMNLYSRKLFRLTLNNAYNPTSVTAVDSFSLPTITVTNGVLRPFALKFYQGKVYVGAVTTGENSGTNILGGTTDMFAYVFELINATGSASFNSTPVIKYPLNYTRGWTWTDSKEPSNYWFPWSDNSASNLIQHITTGFNNRTYPTPILSNIEFSDNGAMIMNFMDRSGHQYGNGNYRNLKNISGTDTAINIFIGGDLIVAGKDCATGVYSLESNGVYTSQGTAYTSSTGANNGQGPSTINGGLTGYTAPTVTSSVKGAGTGTNTLGAGAVNWTTPGGVTAEDGTGAATVATGLTSGQETEDLYATNFGFAIPTDAVITGITARIKRRSTVASVLADFDVSLIQGGTPTGINKAVATAWPITTYTNATYGSSNDRWGLTWTPAQINASNFGLRLIATATASGSPKPEVDYIELTVNYYTKNNSGEFFSYDYGTLASTIYHEESVMGGAAVLRGDAGLIVTHMDPISTTNTGGTSKQSTTNGVGNNGYELYASSGTMDGTFSKGNGLGDIELLGTEPSLEIGNRVWNDANGDGIQNAGEAGIANVGIELYADFNNDGAADIITAATSTNAVDAPLSTSITGNTGSGTTSWTNPANAALNDASIASTANFRNSVVTRDLIATTYGFNIPTNATIVGIVAKIKQRSSVASTIKDNTVQLVKAGTATGTNKASASNWTTTSTLNTYGTGTTDLWGTTWTPAEINATGFGLVQSAINTTGTNASAEVDYMELTVYYTTPDVYLVSSVTTSSSGEYYFNDANITDGDPTIFGNQTGLVPNKTYLIKLASGASDDWDATANSGVGGPRAGQQLVGLRLTKTDKIGNGAVDLSDNDASLVSSIPQITVATGDYGQNTHNLDFGFTPLCKIGDKVWRDEDNDGEQDAAEVGVAGVTVTLLNTSDVPLTSTVTDAYGNYLFDQLAAGSYKVKFTLPPNYTFSPNTNTVDNTAGTKGITVGSDANATTGVTYTIVLTAGENETNIDAGIFFNTPTTTSSVGDFVWYDTDGNGSQNIGVEPGVGGVTVTLWNSAGTGIIATTITDANGYYNFTNVPAATYRVGFTLPPGTAFTTNTGAVTLTTNSDAITSATQNGIANFGQTATFTVAANTAYTYVDAGIVTQSTALASVGDFVWYDNNRDGLQDVGEPGIAGVTVELLTSAGASIDPDGAGALTKTTTVTDAYGAYVFNGLAAGSYKINFTAPSGLKRTKTNVGTLLYDNNDADTTSGTTATFTLIAGAKNMTIDCGMFSSTKTQANAGALGDFVWYDSDGDGVQDSGEPGVAGITVTLYNSSGTAIDTTSTDKNGYYLFTDLAAANYSVGFSNLPANYKFTTQDAGANDAVDSDANGATGKTAQVAVTGGATNSSLDAGLVKGAPSGLGSIGNKVWYDLDNDGLQDVGELGAVGVIVSLYNDADNNGTLAAGELTAVATATTNALGEYMFGGLSAGNYQVGFNLTALSTYTLSTKDAGTDDAADSDGNTKNTAVAGNTAATQVSYTALFALQQGEDKLTVDLGLVPPGSTNTLGNYVWFDADADGVQDATEKGVAGVSVALYNASVNAATNFSAASHNSGTLNFSADLVLKNTASIATGSLAINLSDSGRRYVNPPANYIPDFVTVSFTATKNAAIDNTDELKMEYSLGNNTWTQFALITGLSITAAGTFQTFTYSSSSIPGLLNIKGIRFSNGAGIISGEIMSVDDLDIQFGRTAASATTTTDKNGEYLFTGLADASYSVGFSNLPSGFNFTTQSASNDATGSDADRLTGLTATVALNSGNRNDRTLDAGLISSTAALGNYVWNDLNGDGIQTAGETGVPGVTVTLYNSAGTTALASTITDESGYYNFINLTAGTYVVGFTTAPNQTFTVQDATSEALGTDSDVDPTTAKTASVTLAASEINLNIDAGLNAAKPASIGNYVWSDTDADSLQDATERGVAGVLVTLYNSNNVAIGSAYTDGNGFWQMTNVPAGSGYYLIFTANMPSFNSTLTPNGFPQWSSKIAGDAANGLSSGSESDTDSDVGRIDGKTGTFTIVAGNNFINMDAGITNAASLAPLPVTWLTFKAVLTNDDNDVLLTWSTATEINNSHFEVERSFDGRTFKKIGTVKSKSINGYSSMILDYSKVDNGVPALGVNTLYYRIKQVDFDGKYDYTNIEVIHLTHVSSITLSPNPTAGDITLSLNTYNFNEEVVITISDMSGRELKTIPLSITKGSLSQQNISLKDLENGYYNITVSDSKSSKVFKVLKY